GTASQPDIVPDNSQPAVDALQSDRIMAVAALQATAKMPFELQLHSLMPEEAIVAPTEDSEAATVASFKLYEHAPVPVAPSVVEECRLYKDNFNGIDWSCLPHFIAPVTTQKNKKS
ncbi:hypothetical protein EJ02DRAFT_318781, partial [Clathrospora elynae]